MRMSCILKASFFSVQTFFSHWSLLMESRVDDMRTRKRSTYPDIPVKLYSNGSASIPKMSENTVTNCLALVSKFCASARPLKWLAKAAAFSATAACISGLMSAALHSVTASNTAQPFSRREKSPAVPNLFCRFQVSFAASGSTTKRCAAATQYGVRFRGRFASLSGDPSRSRDIKSSRVVRCSATRYNWTVVRKDGGRWRADQARRRGWRRIGWEIRWVADWRQSQTLVCFTRKLTLRSREISRSRSRDGSPLGPP